MQFQMDKIILLIASASCVFFCTTASAAPYVATDHCAQCRQNIFSQNCVARGADPNQMHSTRASALGCGAVASSGDVAIVVTSRSYAKDTDGEPCGDESCTLYEIIFSTYGSKLKRTGKFTIIKGVHPDANGEFHLGEIRFLSNSRYAYWLTGNPQRLGAVVDVQTGKHQIFYEDDETDLTTSCDWDGDACLWAFDPQNRGVVIVNQPKKRGKKPGTMKYFDFEKWTMIDLKPLTAVIKKLEIDRERRLTAQPAGATADGHGGLQLP